MATKTVSILPAGTNSHTETAENVGAVATDFIANGIVGAVANTSGVAPATGGFAVNAQGTPDMTVAVTQGVAWVSGTPTAGNSQTFRVKMTSSENVTIAANSTGGTRYDYIYIKLDATKLANPNLAADDVATLLVSRSTSNVTDDGTPPTYGYLIAKITVTNGASSIVNANIADSRTRTGINYVPSTSVVDASSLNNPYKFFAYHNTTQSIASGAKISFNTELYDTNSNFASSTYTAPVTGFYRITWYAYFQSTSNVCRASLYKNGAIYISGNVSNDSGSDATSDRTITIPLTAGDTLEIYSTSAGGSKTVYGEAYTGSGGTAIYTAFEGHLVSRT